MLIEILNYEPFYHLIEIRIIHLLLIIPIIYLINKIREDRKNEY